MIPSTTSQRIQYIDRLKGLAMISVIIGHVCIFTFGNNKSLVADIVGSYHMPLFMFLSGFVVGTQPSIRKCTRKVLTFMMPMITIGFLFCLSFGRSYKDFWLDGPKAGYWYLFTLSLFYIILSAIRWNNNEFRKCGFLKDVLILFIVFGILAIMKVALPQFVVGLLSLDQACSLWLCFGGGIFLRKYKLINTLLQHNWLFSLSLLSYIVLVCLYVGGLHRVYIVMGLLAIMPFVYVLKQREGMENVMERELARIGRNSLDI